MTSQRTDRARAGVSGFLVTFFQVLLFLPIQIVFIPVVVVGLLHGVYRGFVKSKQLGVSFSAIRSLHYRWFGHYLNTRPDPLSVAFMKKFPCESHFALWSLVAPLVISRRLFGFLPNLGALPEPGKETLATTPGQRLALFDQIVEAAIGEVDEIVLPGVGFDLVALRYTEEGGPRVFELDQVGTIDIKLATLKRAGIPHDWVTYIPVDYRNEFWADKLLDAGFDPTKKTLFLWQSVSLFLEPDVVKASLRQMADLCVEGSRVAQDFYSSAFVAGKISRAAKKTARMMGRMGEPWIFGIDMSEDPTMAVESLLNECGLKLDRIHQFGEKRGLEPFYCIVECSPSRWKTGASTSV